jgi:hypothetical protein
MASCTNKKSALFAVHAARTENFARWFVDLYGSSSVSPDASEFKEFGPTF